MPTSEEIAAAEAAAAASQQTPEEIAAAEEAARLAAASAAEKEIYTPEELAKITPTDIDLDRVDPAYRPIVENTIRDYKELQKDHTKKSQANREARLEADYWRNLVLKKEETPIPAVETSVPTRPKLEQFETVEQYEDSLLDWHEKKRNVETQLDSTKRRTEEATRKFQSKAAKLRAEYEDFDEVIEAPVFTPAMRMALFNADDGPEMAYYLGKEENRQVATKIASLPVEMQLYELGKLETQLLIAQKTKKVTGAPNPIVPIGTGMLSEEKNTFKDDEDAEWYAWEKKRTRKRLEDKYKGG